MWRTDRYTAPNDPMPWTYQGVANFLHIQDHLIRNRPGYRYENCCNGGPYKGFAICRRMTFCTMNDLDQNPVATRTTYYSCTYGVNPVQLKSDLGPANTPYLMRTHMLGAILSRRGQSGLPAAPRAVQEPPAPHSPRATSITSCPWPTASTGTGSSSSTRT